MDGLPAYQGVEVKCFIEVSIWLMYFRVVCTIFQHITVKHLKQNKVHPVRKKELCYKVCYCFFLKYVHIYFETKLLTKSSYFQYVISNYVYYKDKKNWSNDRWHIKRWTIWSMIGIKHTLTPIYFIPRCFLYFHQMLS